MTLQKQKNQSVQCTIQNSFISIDDNENKKKSISSKSKIQFKNVENMDSKKHNES